MKFPGPVTQLLFSKTVSKLFPLGVRHFLRFGSNTCPAGQDLQVLSLTLHHLPPLQLTQLVPFQKGVFSGQGVSLGSGVGRPDAPSRL